MSENMQRFTQRARRVLSTAQTEAERLNQSMICPEHMLLGLVLDDGGVAYHVLHDLGINSKQTKIIVDRLSAGRNEDTQDGKLRLSPSTELTLKHAVSEAQKLGHDYIGTEHILLSLVREKKGIVIEVLKKLGISPLQVRRHIRRILKEIPPEAENISAEVNIRKSRKKQNKKKKTPLSDQLATDLTKLAESNKLDPVIGRHSEVERLIQILARRTKNNPALIGEPEPILPL